MEEREAITMYTNPILSEQIESIQEHNPELRGGEHNPSELSARIPDYRSAPMGVPVTGVLKTRKGELDSNWCACRIVNVRCLETRIEIEGYGSDDSWETLGLG
jgi:hypothetical protein